MALNAGLSGWVTVADAGGAGMDSDGDGALSTEGAEIETGPGLGDAGGAEGAEGAEGVEGASQGTTTGPALGRGFLQPAGAAPPPGTLESLETRVLAVPA